MYFRIYGVLKTLFDKCLKNPVSEDTLTSNKVNGWKHSSNLNDSSFAIFIDPCENN